MTDFETIDINLYDRQMRTYGLDAIGKMSSSSVLIYGLEQGLGTEIGKNLALGGIKNILLFDSSRVAQSDLTTGFYYSKDDIGKCRSMILVPKLQELNPYITVCSVESYELNQQVTVLINQPIDIVKKVNLYCRTTNTKMIALYSKGFSGVVFVDAGLSHLIVDSTGETIQPVQIGNITSTGIVKCAPNSPHNFQSGDFIYFDNLEGLNLSQFNKDKEWTIKIINNTSFQLEHFNDINDFTFINGTAIHIKKSHIINHNSFEHECNEPTISFSFDTTYAKKLISTYIKMFDIFDIFDTSDDIKDLSCFGLPNHANLINYEFMPVVSLMGSITASEVIKLVTNKYTPINQWFTWSDESLIPNHTDLYKDMKTHYGTLYGPEIENKLINSKWFMVGSGAIGCELLKNLAFMGVSDHSLGLGLDGSITITDPDHIEKSNLNRQFLFRNSHIGQPKSIIAADSIKTLKPYMNIKSLTEKVGSDNDDMTHHIMKNVDGVLNALDNIKARQYMDDMCFKFNLPLFESGTTGTKGNTQPVIPFITETYGASSDPDQEKVFPLCTIKSFPNEISHCIYWAMDQFEFFNRAPSTLNKLINNPSYLDELNDTDKAISMEDIKLFTIEYPDHQTNIITCIRWAIDMFNFNYYEQINKLLETFSPTHETDTGVLFWSAGKKCPKPIIFDINNIQHVDYIEATTRLLAKCVGLVTDITSTDIIKIIQTSTDEQEPVRTQTLLPIYNSQEFEKDDDTNWHINWITASANMRALNYSIPIIDRYEIKGIAGRIIPAIATTTSAVAGLILLEMLKYICGHDKVDTYRSTFINLAQPMLIYSEPIEAPIIDIGGIKLNSWTKLTYKIDSTLDEFKKYYEKMFQTTINMIASKTTIVYAEFLDINLLDKKLSEIISDTSEPILNLVSDDDTKELPTINIILF
jgi:ubiquitin-activating enzyme E1